MAYHLDMPAKFQNVLNYSLVFITGLLIGYIAGNYFSIEKIVNTKSGEKILDFGQIADKETSKTTETEVLKNCDLQVEVAGAINTPGVFCFTEGSIVNKAIEESHKIKAAGFDRLSAEAKKKMARAILFPKVSLDASYKYTAEVPELTTQSGTASRTIKLTDNESYSIGPSINYLLFDFGSNWKNYQSAKYLEEAKEEEANAARTDTGFLTKLNYFNIQFSIEQMRLILDSLRLAMAQHSDIKKRKQAGYSSSLDESSAYKEVLNFKLKYYSTQSNLIAELVNLFNLINFKHDKQELYPLDSSLISNLPEDMEKPNLILDFEKLDNTVKNALEHYKGVSKLSNHKIT